MMADGPTINMQNFKQTLLILIFAKPIDNHMYPYLEKE